MIKYLGSKRRLLPTILRAITAFPGARSILDPFSGTARVGHALKREGYRVIAADHNAYAAMMARCYIQTDHESIHAEAANLMRELNALPGKPGYFTQTFCQQSRFIQPFNGERIDAIREAIAAWNLKPELESVLLTSLVEAADRVDSTTGVQMAYLKSWAPRSFNPLELRMPDVLPRAAAGRCEAHQLDALDSVRRFATDITYLDPPYNQHSYLGNYHMWESLVLWDKPDVYGVACKRVDVRDRTSPFNSARHCAGEMRKLIDAVRSPVLIVSFSNEGYLSRDELTTLLAQRGEVIVLSTDFDRYVGARIGIYNPRGEKVGTPGKLRNTEFLFIAADPEQLQDSHLDELVQTLAAEAV